MVDLRRGVEVCLRTGGLNIDDDCAMGTWSSNSSYSAGSSSMENSCPRRGLMDVLRRLRGGFLGLVADGAGDDGGF
jgi:hypothetical protein